MRPSFQVPAAVLSRVPAPLWPRTGPQQPRVPCGRAGATVAGLGHLSWTPARLPPTSSSAAGLGSFHLFSPSDCVRLTHLGLGAQVEFLIFPVWEVFPCPRSERLPILLRFRAAGWRGVGEMLAFAGLWSLFSRPASCESLWLLKQLSPLRHPEKQGPLLAARSTPSGCAKTLGCGKTMFHGSSLIWALK